MEKRPSGTIGPRCQTCGRGSSPSWPGSRSLLATSGWSGAASGRSTGRPAPPGSSSIPTPTRSGYPTRGSRSSTRSSTSVTTRVAERAYAPWVDMDAELRAAGVPLLLGRHPPRRRRLRRRSPSISRPSSSTRTCSSASTSPGSRCGPSDRRPEHPLVIAGGHCAFNPEPMADFVDAFVIGDGEEAVGEITEVVGAWKRSGRTAREGVLRELATIPGRLRARRCTRSSTTGRSSPRCGPASPTCPSGSTSAPSPTSPSGRTRSSQLVPLIEVVHDRLNVEIFRGCTRGCRFCQAGMITRPVRERPADQVRTMVQDGLRRTGLRRGRAHVALDRRLLGDRRPRRRPGQRAAGLRQRRPVAAVAAGRRVHRRHRQRDPEGAPHRAHVRARGRHVADPPGDQQAHHRRRPLRRGRRRLLAGLAAGEALLPHRRPHRDGRGHARDRRARPRGREDRAQVHEEGERAPRRSAASCPRRTRRSSGSARTASQELQRKVGLLRDDLRKSGAQLRWHDPAATYAEGIASRGATAASARVIERVWRAGGTFQEWSERFELDRWLDAMAAEGLDPDWYVTRHRTEDEILPWDHIAAGLHRDFLWDDWQAALARARAPRLPVDPVLRLRGVHRLRPRARGGLRGRRPRAAARAPARTSAFGARRCAIPLGAGRAGSPVRAVPDEGRHRVPGADPLLEAGHGALHLAPRRRPRLRAGVPHRAAPARVHPGVLAPTRR